MFLKMFPFRRLKIEPGVGKSLDVGKESLDKRMELILKDNNYMCKENNPCKNEDWQNCRHHHKRLLNLPEPANFLVISIINNVNKVKHTDYNT